MSSICHRFLRGAQTVGGVRRDLADGESGLLLRVLAEVEAEFAELTEVLFANTSVMDRFATTGVLTPVVTEPDGDVLDIVPDFPLINKSFELCYVGAGPELAPLLQELDSKTRRILGHSLHIRHVDAGSCNGCDFQMNALLNPVYDLQRLGMDFVASPRHADLLMITGPVTHNLRQAVLKTVEATPVPRLIMALGDCACSGGITSGSYACSGGVDQVVPVDIYVPGCPPTPADIIRALLAALDRMP